MNKVMRQEKKFAIEIAEGARLRARLDQVMLADAHNGPQGYTIRSLYFDTPDDQDFTDKVDGLERVGRFFQNLFLGIASNLPVILCWLIVLAAIFFVCRLLWKRHRRRTAAPAPIHTAPADAKGHADTKGGEQK